MKLLLECPKFSPPMQPETSHVVFFPTSVLLVVCLAYWGQYRASTRMSLKTQNLSSTSQRSWVSTRCTAQLDAIRMTTETSRMKPKSGCGQTPGSRFLRSRVADWPREACSLMKCWFRKSKHVAEEWWRWASADWTIGRTTTSLSTAAGTRSYNPVSVALRNVTLAFRA